MSAFTLLRSALALAVIVGAALLGAWLFDDYWGDVRRVVAYDLAWQSRSLQGEERVGLLGEALTVDEGNWLAALRLGEERLLTGDLEAAERHLDTALRGNPESPLANFIMGVTQFRLGSAETSLPYFEAAAVLDPGNLQYEGMVKQLREALESGIEPSAPSGGALHGMDPTGWGADGTPETAPDSDAGTQ